MFDSLFKLDSLSQWQLPAVVNGATEKLKK
jgi:hypothetical protein